MPGAAAMTDESSQRSACLTEVTAIRGGGIPLGSGLGYAWTVCPEVVDGLEFSDITMRDYRCRSYFENRFAMVSHIRKKPRCSG